MKELKFIREIFVKDNFGKVPFEVVDDYPAVNDSYKGRKIVAVKSVDNKFPNDEMMSLFLITFDNYDCEFVAVEWEV